MRKQKEKKRKRKRRIDRNFYSRGENNKTNLKKDLTQPCPRPRPWIHGLLSLLPLCFIYSSKLGLFQPCGHLWKYAIYYNIFSGLFSSKTSARAPTSIRPTLSAFHASPIFCFFSIFYFIFKENKFLFFFFFFFLRKRGEKEKRKTFFLVERMTTRAPILIKKKEDFELDHLVLLLLRIMINDERQEIRRT